MVKIEFYLSNIEYDTLIDRYLPMMEESLKKRGHPVTQLFPGGLQSPLAKKFIKGLPQSKKDKLLVDLLNANKAELVRSVREVMEKQGIRADIENANASV